MSKILKSVFTLSIIPCHRRCDRSFHFMGKKFPVCARCTGLILGYFSLPFWYFINIDLNILLLIVIVVLSSIPLLVDGFTQLKKLRVSNNYLRLFTGLLSSIGLSLGIVEGSRYILLFLITHLK